MKQFCMPADFKFQTIDGYAALNAQYTNARITETYGQLTADASFGSCRHSEYLPFVDQKVLEAYVRYCKDRKITFNYILNAAVTLNEELTKAGFQKIKSFVKMLEDMGIEYITVTLPSMMEIVRYVAPSLKIKASTVCRIDSPKKAKFFEELGIGRIVLDEDIYRKPNILKSIRKVYSGELEVIINSFCIKDCPYKIFHYNTISLSHRMQDHESYYPYKCRRQHLDGEELIKQNWIRPEDLKYYYDIGIRFFKVQGRQLVLDGDPIRAIRYYMDEAYDGNLVKLLELFAPSHELSIGVDMDNKKLDGYVEWFFKNPSLCHGDCESCKHCLHFAHQSIGENKCKLLSGFRSIDQCIFKEFYYKLDEGQS